MAVDVFGHVLIEVNLGQHILGILNGHLPNEMEFGVPHACEVIPSGKD